jgi:enoyl-[acyl-carrier-protein] reductase (NADH)
MTVVGIKVNAVACGDHRTIVKKIIFLFRDLMTVVGIMGIMAYDLMTVVGIKVNAVACGDHRTIVKKIIKFSFS